MRKNTFHKQTGFTYYQVIASARSAVPKYRTAGLQSNLHSHEENMKSTVQILHAMNQIARLESCFLGQILFITQF